MVNETIKLKFKNKERTLHFGIGPSRILCEDKHITVSQMHMLDVNELVQDMVYASLKFDCFLKNEQVDFNIWEVYQWINDMDQKTFQKIFETFIKTRTIGRSIYSEFMERQEKENLSADTKKKTRRGTT